MMMNYIILLATGLLTRSKIKALRLMMAALLGSGYAVMSYVSKIELYQTHWMKALLSMGMVYIAFLPRDAKKLMKTIISFYLTSFCFGGTAYYLLYYINPSQIRQVNGVLTGSYPIKIAILGGVVGFLVLDVAFKLVKHKLDKVSIVYRVEIHYQGRHCIINTMLDTGHQLREPITGLPVVVVEKEALQELISKETVEKMLSVFHQESDEGIEDSLKLRCRLIPYSSIGKENGMLVGFKPDHINIYDEDGEQITREAMIAIYESKLSRNGTYAGLMGLELLNEITERQVREKYEHY